MKINNDKLVLNCIVWIFILTILLSALIPILSFGMDTTSPLSSLFKVQDTILADFSFTQKWEYPWPVIKDEKTGKYRNALNDEEPVLPADTVKKYYTANCITDHQGEHAIRYCDAALAHDTLILTFSDLDAAYHGYLVVTIVKDSFKSQWHCIYIVKIPREKIGFTTLSQELILNTSDFSEGRILKGRLNIVFREDFSAPGHKSTTGTFFVKGLFETGIKKIR